MAADEGDQATEQDGLLTHTSQPQLLVVIGWGADSDKLFGYITPSKPPVFKRNILGGVPRSIKSHHFCVVSGTLYLYF